MPLEYLRILGCILPALHQFEEQPAIVIVPALFNQKRSHAAAYFNTIPSLATIALLEASYQYQLTPRVDCQTLPFAEIYLLALSIYLDVMVL